MKMHLFKLIEIDIEQERKRIKIIYNKRQQKPLLKLVDLFEAGKFQECLDLINDGKSFPYNKKEHYEEKEHIGIDISNILRDVCYNSYFTSEQLLEQAREKLKLTNKK